jgi:radical SAM protein with 4Fe4S-binding SPASM domain
MYKNIETLNRDDIFSVIKSLPDNQVGRIHLLGGEPMTVPFILDIVKEVRKNGIHISLNTNGYRLSNDINACKFFADNDVGISFSIDGVDIATNDIVRGKGSFDTITKAAKNYADALAAAGKNDVISAFYFTITPDNKHNDFHKLFELASEIGINTLIVGVLIALGAGKENYSNDGLDAKEILRLTKEISEISLNFPKIKLSFPYQTPLLLKYLNNNLKTNFGLCYSKCKSGKTEFSLQADGSLFPCIFVSNLYNAATSELRKQNNLLSYSIDNITENEYYENFIKKMDNKSIVTNITPCNKCPYNIKLDICSPCPYQNIDNSLATNEFHKKSICEVILNSNDNDYYL